MLTVGRGVEGIFFLSLMSVLPKIGALPNWGLGALADWEVGPSAQGVGGDGTGA